MKNKTAAFIGIDGSGKTSLLNALFDDAPESYIVLRQPHKLGIKELINKTDCPLAHAFLYAADRAIQVENLPLFDQDKTILFDRWHDCTIAYQGYGFGVNLDTLNQLGTHFPPLDYVFWLDCPVETAIARSANPNNDRYGSLDFDTLIKIHHGYEAIYMDNRTNPRTKYIRLSSGMFCLNALLEQVKRYL